MILIESNTTAELERLVASIEGEVNVDSSALNRMESAMLQLAQQYSGDGIESADKILNLIKITQSLFSQLSKAKAGNLFKQLLGQYLDCEDKDLDTAISLCNESIAWSITEKRTLLRQSIEARLVELYLLNKRYSQSLELANKLITELRKIDDKNLLIDVLLVESQAHFYLHNYAKARASLTSARTYANAVYCAPHIQSALDMQSGILHAVDKDFATGFSYFYEAYEGYETTIKSLKNINKTKSNSSTSTPIIKSGISTRSARSKAVVAIKYLLLCKIMLDQSEEATTLINTKLILDYSGVEVEAMAQIAKAYQSRSLVEFEATTRAYSAVLVDDPIVGHHLTDLYNKMLENNLIKLIEPYSRVEIKYIADKIGLSEKSLEMKLSAMILDKKLNGILDQSIGVLITFKPSKQDKIFATSLDIIHSMSTVVGSLYAKALQS